ADTQQTNVPRRPKSAAYVAPIPKIGSIPTFSPGIQFSPTERPKLPPFVGSFLMGKPVDEYGDIVDEKTGQVLARAGGDLPSLVGRKVSNRQGDILGEDGELLGYVADIEIERKGSAGSSMQSPHAAPPRSLFDIMGRSNASLMVDHVGNILDAGGNVVGKFHDNNNPLHRKEREERESQGQQQQQNEPSGSRTNKPESPFPPPPLPAPQELPEQQPEQQQGGEQEKSERRPRRTEEERRQTAADWRKEKPGESPSDIFLDVKSTTEGIQLTIRIPTVFGGGQQVRPNIS
ncbi:hypothetical protein B0T26DRAFT_612179, partial [Lasiosphaeria miniovina]